MSEVALTGNPHLDKLFTAVLYTQDGKVTRVSFYSDINTQESAIRVATLQGITHKILGVNLTRFERRKLTNEIKAKHGVGTSHPNKQHLHYADDETVIRRVKATFLPGVK